MWREAKDAVAYREADQGGDTQLGRRGHEYCMRKMNV